MLTAVVTCGDLMAIGVMRVCHVLGPQVPRVLAMGSCGGSLALIREKLEPPRRLSACPAQAGQDRQGYDVPILPATNAKTLQGAFRDFVDFPLNGPFFWRSWRLGGLKISDWG